MCADFHENVNSAIFFKLDKYTAKNYAFIYICEHLINASYLKKQNCKFKPHFYKSEFTNNLTKSSLCLSILKNKKVMYFCQKEKICPQIKILSKYINFRPHFTQKVYFLLHTLYLMLIRQKLAYMQIVNKLSIWDQYCIVCP